MVLGETIAAIATAPGRGGVAIVRVSGPAAFEIASCLTGRSVEPGRIAFARVKAPGSGLVVDEAVVLAFRAPHSYTGEDVVEFQCHGGTVSPRRVLEACCAAGARLARRGEFTQRAFLNGKLDFDQAESVLDLVDARTDRAADVALQGLSGRKRREDRALYETALSVSTELEHALDVDESDLPDDFLSQLAAKADALRAEIDRAIRQAREGRILREGALVVLAGPPNAGKSSLMNALLEENRAIVSETPGTTRDSIEEWLDLDGWPVRLVDTAGLRETCDAIEAEGVKRAETLIGRADIVIRLLPAQEAGECDESVATTGREIRVTSKCDVLRGTDLNVSVRTGEGIDELKRRIVSYLEAAAAAIENAQTVGDERLAVFQRVSVCLAKIDWNDITDLVIAGNQMRTIAEDLGSLVGATYSADLLDRLFSRFCVGK